MEKFKLKNYQDQVNDWTDYEPLTLKEGVLAFCYQCCGYDRKEVKISNCTSCPLYQFKEKYYNKRNIFKN